MLKKRDTCIHFTVDGWTDMSNVHFLGIKIFMEIEVTGTFLMMGEVRTAGLEFVKCAADGESMSREFINIFERFDIQDKLFITSDNCKFSENIRCIKYYFYV